MRPEWAVLAAGLGLLFPIQGSLDAVRGEPPLIVETLPPESILPALAAGHRETLADVLEIKSTTFLMKRMKSGYGFSDLDRDYLWKLYNAILKLDPNNADACWRAGVFMGAVGNRPHAAIALLKRGLGEPYEYKGERFESRRGVDPRHPRRWRLYHEQAATWFLMLRNRAADERERMAALRKSGELWIQAGEVGDLDFLVQIGRRLANRKMSKLELLEHEFEQWKERARLGNEATREEALRRMVELRSAHKREQLQRMINRLWRRGRRFTSLSQLKEDVSDPLGIGFLLRDHKVISPGCAAASLQRDLRHRFHRWRETHPDSIPTLQDLGQKEPIPDYLEAKVTAEGVTVEARASPLPTSRPGPP